MSNSLSPNMQSSVTLLVNGVEYTNWSECTVERHYNAIAGAFSVTIGVPANSNNLRYLEQIQPFNECTLLLDSEVVITGYIDEFSHSYSATEHSISIQGRDKTADLVDCSAVAEKSEYWNVSLEYIINTLCKPYSINSIFNTKTPRIEKFTIENTETAFEALDRLCRMQGLIATSNPNGDLVITKKSTARASVVLETGVNILSSNYTYNATELFSEYKMLVTATTWKTNTFTRILTDSSVPRRRIKFFKAEDLPSTASADARLEEEANNNRAKARTLNITVQGWREYNGGSVWLPNKVVRVKDSILGLEEDFFIASVSFSYGSGGSITSLKLEEVL